MTAAYFTRFRKIITLNGLVNSRINHQVHISLVTSFVLAFLLLIGLYGCGKKDLSRPDAEKLIHSSDKISQFARVISVQPDTLTKGQAEGAWKILNNGATLLGEKARKSITSVGYNGIELVNPTMIDVKVTGIADVPVSENMKEAQFTWAYVELPSLVKRFAFQGGSGSASFRLFDDGWRLENVQIQVSNVPVVLSPKEQEEELADIQAEDARIRLAIEQQAKHIQDSRVPTKVIETFSFPTFTNLGNKAWEKPIMQNIVVTDVDVEFIEHDHGKKMKLWFGNIWNIGEVGGSTCATIAAYSTGQPWIPIDTYQRRNQFMTTLKSAVESWRAKFGDVPHD